MATHSSVLAWRIPGTGEPGGLPSMGSHRVDTTEPTQQQQQQHTLLLFFFLAYFTLYNRGNCMEERIYRKAHTIQSPV